MASNTEHIFNNLAYTRLKTTVAAGDPTFYLHNGGAQVFLPGWVAGKYMYLTLTDSSSNVEIVKVTAISGDNLTVERGQDGTVASAWYAGTIIAQRLVAANLDAFLQNGVFRTIAYNPNGVISASYPGEKVYQTGGASCNTRWWMNTSGTKWRLIAGALCDYEYYDGDGYAVTPPEHIHIFGGTTTGPTNLQETYEYDPDTWTSRPDMPMPGRTTLAACTLNATFAYVLGGKTSSWLRDCDEYSVDIWVSRTNMPNPGRSRLAAAPISNKAYVFGGQAVDIFTEIKDVDEYDPDTWTSKTDLASATDGIAASAIDDKIYLFGGHTSPYLKTCYEYVVDVITAKTDMPDPVRGYFSAAAIGSKGYVFGGVTAGAVEIQDTDEYDPSGDSWDSKTDLLAPARNYLAANAYNSKGYVFGGNDGSYRDDTDEYDPSGDSWDSKTAMNRVRSALASAMAE